jgi:cullin-associated NEDD8-dissociated protein 1
VISSHTFHSLDDLSLSQLIWVLISEINLHSSGVNMDDKVLQSLLHEMIQFLYSDLLQGAALAALANAFASFLNLRIKSISFGSIVELLMAGARREGISRHSLQSISRCVAEVVLKASPGDINSSIDRFVEGVKSNDVQVQIVSLLSLGEIGKKNDLSHLKELETQTLSAFSSPNDNVRYASSIALGGITAGNLARYVPVLRSRLIEAGQGGATLYLLLNSMKEALQLSGKSFFPYTKDIAPVLQAKIEVEDDAIRSLISECLGRLIAIDPTNMVPLTELLISSSKPSERSVGITSLKFIATMDLHTLNTCTVNLDNCFATLKDSSVVSFLLLFPPV